MKNKETLRQRMAEDNGTFALVSSFLLLIGGVLIKNYTIASIGGLCFAYMLNALVIAIKAGREARRQQMEIDSYIAKKDFELKADLLAKAYEDGRISDDDISYLVRSLAKTNTDIKGMVNTINKPIVNTIVEPIISADIKDVEVITENTETTNEEVEVTEDRDTKQDTKPSVPEILQFTINSGKFCFRYNNKDMAIAPTDVVKGQFLHEEFDDSFGYHQNNEATFYIYPADRKIVAVNN